MNTDLSVGLFQDDSVLDDSGRSQRLVQLLGTHSLSQSLLQFAAGEKDKELESTMGNEFSNHCQGHIIQIGSTSNFSLFYF